MNPLQTSGHGSLTGASCSANAASSSCQWQGTASSAQTEGQKSPEQIAWEMSQRASGANLEGLGETLGRCFQNFWGERKVEPYTGPLGVNAHSTRELIRALEQEEFLSPYYVALTEKLQQTPTKRLAISNLNSKRTAPKNLHKCRHVSRAVVLTVSVPESHR